MALVSPAYHANSSYMQSGNPSSSQDDLDDDLLDLLGSDTFSLESHRDKDLLTLASILQNALPSSGTSAGPHGHGGAQWIGEAPPSSSSSSSTGGSGWNGWKPDCNAAYSGSYGLAGPSTSAASTASFFPSPHPPPATPLPYSSSPLPFSASSPESTRRYPRRSGSNSNSNNSSQFASHHQVNNGGLRAPAASRERDIPGRARQSSYSMDVNATAGWSQGQAEEDDDSMEMEDDETTPSGSTTAGSSGFSNIATGTALGWTPLATTTSQTGAAGHAARGV